MGLISESDAELVDVLCTRAAFQASVTIDSRTLETGCPALWAVALTQEVWARQNHGWVVEDEIKRDEMSFATMEATCYSAHGEKTMLPEVHTNESIEYRKTKKQRECGVMRRFSSHCFGGPEQILAKLDCLDSLLKASDPFESKGLHGDIARAIPPALIRKPKPIAGSSGALREAVRTYHSKFGLTASGPSTSCGKLHRK
jgi:hypothetical protein